MSLLLYYYSSVCTIQYIIFSFPLLVGKAIAVNFIRFSFSFFCVILSSESKNATVKINNKYFLKAPRLIDLIVQMKVIIQLFVTEVNCVQRERWVAIWYYKWGLGNQGLLSWVKLNYNKGQGKTYFWRKAKDDMKRFVVKV